MISLQKKEEGLITRYPIVGSRRLSNYWWSVVIFLGGCGFLFTGLSSFFERNLLLLQSPEGVTKLPKLELATQLSKDKARELGVTSVFFLNPQGKGFDRDQAPPLDAKLEETAEQLLTLNESKQSPFRSFTRFSPEPITSDLLTASTINTNFVGMPTESEAGSVLPTGSEIRLISIFNQVPLLPFFPQGLVLSFYGFLGVTFSFHLFFALFWEIGGGFNEINKKEKSVRIFRWGRPGKNRRIDLKYSNELMDAIKIELNPKPALFLCLKGDKKIPLTRIGELLPLEDLETQAAELTSLLQVPLEIVDS